MLNYYYNSYYYKKKVKIVPIIAAYLFLVTACGSGTDKRLLVDGSQFNPSSSTPSVSVPAPATFGNENNSWESGVFETETVFKNKCVSPRFNVTNPLSGQLYIDNNGVALDEKNWLRSWTNNTYLWYDEVADQDPSLFTGPILEYFNQLKTNSTTSSGKEKDYFHFSQKTSDYIQQSQSGVSYGYGIEFDFSTAIFDSIPRQLTVVYLQPDSPAIGKIRRGSSIIEVDGIDFVNGIDTQEEAAKVNEALFPSTEGVAHTFKILDNGATETRTVTVTSALVTTVPVHNVKVIETDSGKVGYFQFNQHIATAPEQLHDAVTTLKEANVEDLILDLRYNGGGAIYVAHLLSSMIADPEIALGRVFNKTKFNDKHPEIDPVTQQPLKADLFVKKYSDIGFINAEPIPNLGLNRIFILTGAGTCSASELIINALRGVDIDVISIGAKTCGKPYGFYPTDNCSTTYFSIQMSASNDKGFGDYAEGFTPVNSNDTGGVRLSGCAVSDDLSQPLGSTNEAQLAAALKYRETGICPTAPMLNRDTTKRATPSNTLFNHVQPQWKSNMFLSFPNKDLRTKTYE